MSLMALASSGGASAALFDSVARAGQEREGLHADVRARAEKRAAEVAAVREAEEERAARAAKAREDARAAADRKGAEALADPRDRALDTIARSLAYHIQRAQEGKRTNKWPPGYTTQPAIWNRIQLPFWLKLMARSTDCAFSNAGYSDEWEGCTRDDPELADDACKRSHSCLLCRSDDHYVFQAADADESAFACEFMATLAAHYDVGDDMEVLRAALPYIRMRAHTAGWFAEGATPRTTLPAFLRAVRCEGRGEDPGGEDLGGEDLGEDA